MLGRLWLHSVDSQAALPTDGWNHSFFTGKYSSYSNLASIHLTLDVVCNFMDKCGVIEHMVMQDIIICKTKSNSRLKLGLSPSPTRPNVTKGRLCWSEIATGDEYFFSGLGLVPNKYVAFWVVVTFVLSFFGSIFLSFLHT